MGNCCRDLWMWAHLCYLLAHRTAGSSLFLSEKLVFSWGFPLLLSRLRTRGSLEARGQSNFCIPMQRARKAMGCCHDFSLAQREFWSPDDSGSHEGQCASLGKGNPLLYIFSRGQSHWHALPTNMHWAPLSKGGTTMKRTASSLPSWHQHGWQREDVPATLT